MLNKSSVLHFSYKKVGWYP